MEKKSLIVLCVFCATSWAWSVQFGEEKKEDSPKDGECFVRYLPIVCDTCSPNDFVQAIRVDPDGMVKVAVLKTVEASSIGYAKYEPKTWTRHTCPPSIHIDVDDFERILEEENVGKCFTDGEHRIQVTKEYKQGYVYKILDDRHYQIWNLNQRINDAPWKESECPSFEKMSAVSSWWKSEM